MKERVRAQFGAAAAAYVASPGHAAGDDLAEVVRLAGPRPGDRALDIATGGGHMALAMAAHVAEVVTTDLTPQMLAAAAELAADRGITNVLFLAADAEALPFANDSFDIVTSRIAPHHFPEPAAFVREAARVLRPGGRFVLDDNMAPEDPDLDRFMNHVEAWRDPGHVRAWRLSEWTTWVAGAGLDVVGESTLRFKRHQFGPWTARINMPPADRDALAAWLAREAPTRPREFFRLEVGETGTVEALSFTWAILAATKPGRP